MADKTSVRKRERNASDVSLELPELCSVSHGKVPYGHYMPIVTKMHNRLSKQACTAILIFETAHIYMYLENCIYETSKNT